MTSNSPPTADLVDDFEDIVTACTIQFRDFGGRKRFCGPIRTVSCRNDNQLIKTLMGEPGDGAVLVVDGGASMDTALMGDLIASKGMNNSWSGAVILGPIRDSVVIGGLDFGVKALGTVPIKSAKAGAGAVDEVLAFGGATFTPGHWIYCDEDGVLVAPHELTSP